MKAKVLLVTTRKKHIIIKIGPLKTDEVEWNDESKISCLMEMTENANKDNF